jgi:tetratricopeptide (TPR) repeat protein
VALDLPRAQKLQEAMIAWHRRKAADALAVRTETLDDSQRAAIRNVAVTVEGLGHILLQQSKSGCLDCYLEAMSLYQRIGNRHGEGVVAYNLGHTYQDVPGVRDLDQAEHWYQRSLERFGPDNTFRRAQVISELGGVAFQRFRDGRAAGEPVEQLTRHLQDAADAYEQALQLLPIEDVRGLSVVHHQLGLIYGSAGYTDRALQHYRQSIQYKEQQDDRYSAGRSRLNAAIALWEARRNREALLYAHAALRDFETTGPGAASDTERARQLIAELEQLPQHEPEGSTDA